MSQYTVVSKQPSSFTSMECRDDGYLDEKRQSGCGCDNGVGRAPMHHNSCHNHRLRRFVVPALGLLLAVGAIIAFISCAGEYGFSGMAEGLVARATDPNNPNQSPFISRKLYLIVIFVGLLVVIILAIMLSVWCCRGAFENPLCCPCYLCACCGGLACLECIGCGLCCEGIDELAG
ncbi:hypothetical protein HGRIS_010941 [Hohenbuehelia grisea]|uniref:Transmembrane protein n=1 Tax=Hohenbuehelia grisea TaxID=104357 RepID=A0ABR3IYM5_9AGAR